MEPANGAALAKLWGGHYLAEVNVIHIVGLVVYTNDLNMQGWEDFDADFIEYQWHGRVVAQEDAVQMGALQDQLMSSLHRCFPIVERGAQGNVGGDKGRFFTLLQKHTLPLVVQ